MPSAGSNPPNVQVIALRDRALELRRAGRPREARDLALEALERVRACGRTTLEPELLLLIGNCAADEGHFEQAEEALIAAAREFRDGGRNNEFAQTMISRGRVLAERGEYDQAVEFFKQLVDLPLPAALRSQVLGNLGVLQRRRGELGEAIDLLRQDVAVCEQSGDEYGSAVARLNLAIALVDARRYQAASSHAKAAAEALDRLGAAALAERARALINTTS